MLSMGGTGPPGQGVSPLPHPLTTCHYLVLRVERRQGCSLMNWGVNGNSDAYFLGHACGSAGG